MCKGFKKIGIIALSVFLEVFSSVPHYTFASNSDDLVNVSFGEVGSSLDSIRGLERQGSYKNIYRSSLMSSVTNIFNYYNWDVPSLSSFDSFFNTTFSDGVNIFDFFIDKGWFPNLYYQRLGIISSGEDYFIIVFRPPSSASALVHGQGSPSIRSSVYPSLVNNCVLWSELGLSYSDNTTFSVSLDPNVLYGSVTDSSISVPSSALTLDSCVFYLAFNLDGGVVNNLRFYFVYTDNSGLQLQFYGPRTSSVYYFDPTFCLTCFYPDYSLYTSETPVVSSGSYNGFYTVWKPVSSDAHVSVSDLTLHWAEIATFEPLFPTPTPLPTVLPTITPTPLPLAYDSSIDGMSDGSTLGFLDSLKGEFDKLINSFTGIGFVSQTIGYMYHYIPQFAFLWVVPLIAFLSFLLGRNKS